MSARIIRSLDEGVNAGRRDAAREGNRLTITGNLATEQRLDALRAVLARDGSLQLAEAAVALGVSEMTVRRDLVALEQLGEARRVRGGAVAVIPTSFADRHKQHARAKASIAAKLAPLVPDRGAIGVDASSTLMRLTRALEPRRELTVLTNGLDSFCALAGVPGVRPVLTGGELDPRTGSLVGPLATHAAGQLMLRRLFVSSAGLDPTLGTGETCLEEAEVKQAMANVAADVVVAVDASKLGSRGTALGLAWGRISVLVTELDPADPRLDPYRGQVEIR
jgi:DeoR family fructose operon transcriptional repressor